jgi:hypothetical protein
MRTNIPEDYNQEEKEFWEDNLEVRKGEVDDGREFNETNSNGNI